MTPTTVACAADALVTAASPLRHRCPHVREIDDGHIEVTWRTAGQTIELHSLRAYFAGFADAEMSHEEITDRIRHDLSALPGIELTDVRSAWNTAGMEVACCSVLTLAVTP